MKLLVAVIFVLFELSAVAEKVDFARDVRPILSENCFACHGPDAKSLKGGLRLDLKDSATKPAKSGAIAAVPGDPAKSELIRRIQVSEGNDDHMPPIKSGHKLSSLQMELLKRWIQEGPEFGGPWAFIAPVRPELPKVVNTSWPRNPVDRFILAKLESKKLKPSPQADAWTLLRRVTLDLTGLPPTLEEIKSFTEDKSVHAFEKVVDRLLASPHYGERMAQDWLDASRYADTHGYHLDSGRDMTSWRDWVIDAFNQNKPFDQFTVEQLAGDLLSHASRDQRIASGFNRNHMINYEGGSIADEFQTAYVMDRVNTTATVWLGLTLSCAQCHDHKFDPLTSKDYYRMYAFFNNIPEKGLDGREGNAGPVMQVPSQEEEARMNLMTKKLEAATAKAKEIEASLPALQREWESTVAEAPYPQPSGLVVKFALDESVTGVDAHGNAVPSKWNGSDKPPWTDGRIGKALKFGGRTDQFLSSLTNFDLNFSHGFSMACWIKQIGLNSTVIAKMDEDRKNLGFDLFVQGDKVVVELVHAWPTNTIRVLTKNTIPRDKWIHVAATYDGSSKAAGVRIYVNGRLESLETDLDTLSGDFENATSLNLGRRSTSYPLYGELDEVEIYGRALDAKEVFGLSMAPGIMMAKEPKETRSQARQIDLADFFKYHNGTWFEACQAQTNAQRAIDALNQTIPTTMVMHESDTPRESFVLLHGQYDQKGESVSPATPAALPPMDPSLPRNRLGLARWLVSPENPLTSRVIVNRFWQMHFGAGIVRTPEDFGSQGDLPTHPELLDWLATEFTRTGWNVKEMQKLIVMSATYQQSSAITKDSVVIDPEDRLLSHSPRVRLPAEFIRDQALAASGLLNLKIGGPAINPYQPPGLWEELMERSDSRELSAQQYVQSHGDDLYRRSIYIFWKRSSPPASLAVLDAPDRQLCTIKRQRTNTPLQALVLLNDPTYVEAARRLAERLMREAKTDSDRLALAYRLVLCRDPSPKEMSLLLPFFSEQRSSFHAAPETIEKLQSVGESGRDAHLDSTDVAAWTVVMSAIFNLDESVTLE